MTREERRRRILDAAREVYAEAGGLSAGLRPVAAKAGVTTGAIYAVFDGKEDIYAALLDESLGALAGAVTEAMAAADGPQEAVRLGLLAWFDYYAEREFDYGLGLYQFERDGRKGLGAERDAALNAALDRSLAPLRSAIVKTGDPTPDQTVGMLFAVASGALAMKYSRRDRSLRVEARALVAEALDRLIR